MAINPSTKYPTQVITSDPDWPYAKAKNETALGLKNGTPLEEAWVSDVWGFLQSLLVRAGITPDGNADRVGASQYMDALDQRFGMTGNLVIEAYEAIYGQPTPRDKDFSGVVSGITGVAAGGPGQFIQLSDGSSTLVERQLSRPFDQSSESSYGTLDLSAFLDAVHGLAWSGDGSLLYYAGEDAGSMVMGAHSATVPFRMLSSSIAQAHSLPGLAPFVPTNLSFSDDGTRLLIAATDNATQPTSVRLQTHTLSTPWDSQTATLDATRTIDLGELYQAGAVASDDGLRLFIVANSNMREWQMATPWDIAGAVATNRQRSFSSLGAITGTVNFNTGGGRMYVSNTDRELFSFYSSLVRKL